MSTSSAMRSDSEPARIEDLKEAHAGQWLVIDVRARDHEGSPETGILVGASRDPDGVDEIIRTSPERGLFIAYAGQVPTMPIIL